jgi:hypothetical protein
MMTLHRLIIVAAAFALHSAAARAGMPMMDDPLPLSVRGGTSCTGVCNMTAKSKPQGAGAGSQSVSPYKTYRDRLGFGSPVNGAPRLRR